MLEINSFSNKILNDISFCLQENENLIILGDNGAGKSTLAKVLCNIIKNEKVKIFNQKFDDLSDEQRVRYINYIPSTLEIFDEYITAYEFLELSFIKQIDRKILNEVISLLGINSFLDTPCANLSSGERKLILLASSIIHDAKITIFDELSANMDIVRVKEVYKIFKSEYLNQKIIITHNLDLAYHLKYKILYLEKGSIKFFGDANTFFEKENIDKFYHNSLKLIDEHLVIKL